MGSSVGGLTIGSEYYISKKDFKNLNQIINKMQFILINWGLLMKMNYILTKRQKLQLTN